MCGRYEQEEVKASQWISYNSLDRTESYSPVNQKLIIVRFLNDVQVFNEEVAVLNLFGYFLLKNYGRMKREERKIER
jgi:hypothetical protein